MRAACGYVVVAVLWVGTALAMLAGAAGSMAWMQWSGARHGAEVQRARAEAEGALLWLAEALDQATRAGRAPPVAPPALPNLDGGEVRVTVWRVRADGGVDLELTVIRPTVRVVAGAGWAPP